MGSIHAAMFPPSGGGGGERQVYLLSPMAPVVCLHTRGSVHVFLFGHVPCSPTIYGYVEGK